MLAAAEVVSHHLHLNRESQRWFVWICACYGSEDFSSHEIAASLWIALVFNRRKEERTAMHSLQSVDSFAILNHDREIKKGNL